MGRAFMLSLSAELYSFLAGHMIDFLFLFYIGKKANRPIGRPILRASKQASKQGECSWLAFLPTAGGDARRLSRIYIDGPNENDSPTANRPSFLGGSCMVAEYTTRTDLSDSGTMNELRRCT